MRLRVGFLCAAFLAVSVSAHGDTIVFDNFSCPDSLTFLGASGFDDRVITCSGSLGGEREDGLLVGLASSSSVATMNSDPPSGAISGTFGSGEELATMVWGNLPEDELNLNLVGDSILVQLQSASAGALTLLLCSSGTSGSSCNGYETFATFSGSSGYQDVRIPLTGPGFMVGSGGNLDDVNTVSLSVALDTQGSTWSIDAVEAVPEPSTLLLLTIGMLLVTRFGRTRTKTTD